MGENIADLAGVAMAYRAYKLSLNGKPAPVIDGYTGDQRFFIGWAQGWARKYRDDELRRRLLTDPHSPSEYRTNVIVANLPEFYSAFDVKPGDKMYRAPGGARENLVIRRELRHGTVGGTLDPGVRCAGCLAPVDTPNEGPSVCHFCALPSCCC